MRPAFAKSLIAALLLSMSMSAAPGRESEARPAHEAGAYPTHFDFVVLASLADSGNWVGLSTYRFRRRTDSRSPSDRQYSRTPGFQGGGLAGFNGRSTDRRSSQIT
jgi:hypothetical protein